MDVSDLRTREPGESHVDPYEDTDVEDLPDWWAAAVEEHEEHDLRPYQPPRFEDGELKYEIVKELEEAYGISITFKGVGVTYGDDWTILVDGEEVSEIERRRDVAGYSVFEVESDEFIALIEDHLEGPNGAE
jgi:hypothetical protein